MMKSKLVLLVAGLLCSLVSLQVQAEQIIYTTGYPTVVYYPQQVVVATSEVKQPECTTGYETRSTGTRGNGGSPAGALIGGLIGGLVGSGIGAGVGATAAAGVGIMAGAVAGDRIANPEQFYEKVAVKHCR